MTNFVIETNHLTCCFGDLIAVNQVDLLVPRGSVYGFLGPNGAGKSTTIRLLLGLIHPDAGDVKLFGLDFTQHRRAILQRVGTLVETPSLYPHLSGRENLAVTQTLIGAMPSRVDQVLDIVRLAPHADRRVREYSLGMKQRLGVGPKDAQPLSRAFEPGQVEALDGPALVGRQASSAGPGQQAEIDRTPGGPHAGGILNAVAAVHAAQGDRGAGLPACNAAGGGQLNGKQRVLRQAQVAEPFRLVQGGAPQGQRIQVEPALRADRLHIEKQAFRGRCGANGGQLGPGAIRPPPAAAFFVEKFDTEGMVNAVEGLVGKEEFRIADEAAGQVGVVGIEKGDEGVAGFADSEIAGRPRAAVGSVGVAQEADLAGVPGGEAFANGEGVVGRAVFDEQDFGGFRLGQGGFDRAGHITFRVINGNDD